MSDVDISRKAVELAADRLQYDDDKAMILELRAALDRAEADRVAAVEALTELLDVSKRAVRLSADFDGFKLYAMEPMHQAIAAAIRARGDRTR